MLSRKVKFTLIMVPMRYTIKDLNKTWGKKSELLFHSEKGSFALTKRLKENKMRIEIGNIKVNSKANFFLLEDFCCLYVYDCRML